jgi:hypothetical protein
MPWRYLVACFWSNNEWFDTSWGYTFKLLSNIGISHEKGAQFMTMRQQKETNTKYFYFTPEPNSRIGFKLVNTWFFRPSSASVPSRQ